MNGEEPKCFAGVQNALRGARSAGFATRGRVPLTGYSWGSGDTLVSISRVLVEWFKNGIWLKLEYIFLPIKRIWPLVANPALRAPQSEKSSFGIAFGSSPFF